MDGATLSHYKILAELSRSGMEIVYKVAWKSSIKHSTSSSNARSPSRFFPPKLVSDPERKRRFVQEAQAAVNPSRLRFPTTTHDSGLSVFVNLQHKFLYNFNTSPV